MAYVNRDPFARTETHKEFQPGGKCKNCGMQTTVKGRQGSYTYRTESDGGRVFKDRYYFCSLDCRESYSS